MTGEVRQKIFDIKMGKPDFNDCRNSLLLLHKDLLCAFDDYSPQTSNDNELLLSLIAAFYSMPVLCESLDTCFFCCYTLLQIVRGEVWMKK